LKVRNGLAALASLACTWYGPGRADDATVTQPGRLMVRFQLSDSWAGTPRRSSARLFGWPRGQSAESQMTRPDEETSTCSLAGLRLKVQTRDAVETA
jgi:hypothetical protein